LEETGFVELEIKRKDVLSMAQKAELYTVEKVEDGKWRVISPDGSEYGVAVIEIEEPRFFAYCTCEHFTYRRTLCKHIAKVLKESYDISTNRFNVPKKEEWKDEEIQTKEEKKEVEDLEKKDEKKEKAEKVAESTQVLLMADQEDEKIAEELGVISPDSIALENYPLIYTFTDKNGKEHRFLSLAGWLKCAQLQGNIQVRIDKIIEHNGKTAVIAVAKDLRRNIEMPGLSTRATRKEFELEILASKAIRNALKKVVDPSVVQKILTVASERGQFRRLEVVWE